MGSAANSSTSSIGIEPSPACCRCNCSCPQSPIAKQGPSRFVLSPNFGMLRYKFSALLAVAATSPAPPDFMLSKVAPPGQLFTDICVCLFNCYYFQLRILWHLELASLHNRRVTVRSFTESWYVAYPIRSWAFLHPIRAAYLLCASLRVPFTSAQFFIVADWAHGIYGHAIQVLR